MIVVDVGCHPQGPEESVHTLRHRFEPDILYGFDPYPDLEEGVEVVGRTTIVRRRAAAWTHDGEQPLLVDGICTGVDVRDLSDPRIVFAECFDLAAWMRMLPRSEEVVLKLDCEGAEYVLLPALRRSGIDERISLVLVEWHPVETSHGYASERPELHCDVEEWG